MKSITREKLLACILEYVPDYEAFIPEGKKIFTGLDLLEIEEIPPEDRLSIVIVGGFIRPSHLHEFACACAERALCRAENPDPRSIAAILAKRERIRGEITDEGSSAVRDAAKAAAKDAAKYAAWAAVWEAAGEVAGDAAKYAAWAAAGVSARPAADNSAAWYAVCEAAWESERTWQVDVLKELLREAEA